MQSLYNSYVVKRNASAMKTPTFFAC